MAHQIRGEETRARILAAAAACFTHSGYDTTAVSEICDRAGVSKGAFYHHFASKQSAFLALFHRWLSGVDASIQATRALALTAPQRLEGLAAVAQQVTESGTGQIPMFLEFWRQAARDPEIWRATIEPYGRFRAALAEMVRDGVAEGTLRPVDPDIAARLLVSLGVGLVLQSVLEPDRAEWSSTAGQAIRLLLDGLARNAPSGLPVTAGAQD